jgi:hypothetical protein
MTSPSKTYRYYQTKAATFFHGYLKTSNGFLTLTSALPLVYSTQQNKDAVARASIGPIAPTADLVGKKRA